MKRYCFTLLIIIIIFATACTNQKEIVRDQKTQMASVDETTEKQILDCYKHDSSNKPAFWCVGKLAAEQYDPGVCEYIAQQWRKICSTVLNKPCTEEEPDYFLRTQADANAESDRCFTVYSEETGI